MCVRLQKLAIKQNYLGDRFVWKDGLLIEFGDTKCLLERLEDISTIKVCVQGKVDNLGEVCEVTRSIRTAHTSILDEYEGVLKDDYMLCCHCLVCGKLPVKKWLPHETNGTWCYSQTSTYTGSGSIGRSYKRIGPVVDVQH